MSLTEFADKINELRMGMLFGNEAITPLMTDGVCDLAQAELVSAFGLLEVAHMAVKKAIIFQERECGRS